MNKYLFAKTLEGEYLGPISRMINRHGLISGATGTGKTVTLKKFAELLSAEGVPTFVIDVKGDLTGFASPGAPNEKFAAHIAKFGENYPDFQQFPVNYWDLYGENGLPIRTTVTNLGPALLSKLLEINDTQSAVVQTLFKYADDQGLLLLDFKDFKELVEFAMSHPDPSYGSLPKASLSAVLRQLNSLEAQGIDAFFGERELDLFDFQQLRDGKGVINLLDATKLFLSPKMYSTFLLWLLSELYEQFDEVGDLDKPRMVFFFDEAHLIFDGISGALLSSVEQVVRLIRSKGIGIYFVSQSPADIPDSVLGQLGNRVQHAMRAYTAKEIKNLKIASQGFRVNPELNIEKALMELGVGEAIVSFLDESGVPEVTKRAYILSPSSLMGRYEISDKFPNAMFNSKYRVPIDRESAYEVLEKLVVRLNDEKERERERIEREKQAKKNSKNTLADRVGRSVINSMTRQTGNMIARGIMGTIKRVLR